MGSFYEKFFIVVACYLVTGDVKITSAFSNNFKSYKEALKDSQNRFIKLMVERFENTRRFYEEFLKTQIRDYNWIGKDPAKIRVLRSKVHALLHDTAVRFAAIDGTCKKQQLSPYMVFFGGAYAARGTISFEADALPTYERWSVDQDVSFVAYVPIPFAELGDVTEQENPFVERDSERADLSRIHLLLMQLAEVYLAYDLVRGSSLRPKLVLWDQSLSSMMMGTWIGKNRVLLLNNEHAGFNVTDLDHLIVYSHPYNESLGIPTFSPATLHQYLLFRLFKDGYVDLNEIRDGMASRFNVSAEVVDKVVERRILATSPGLGWVSLENDSVLVLNKRYKNRWQRIVQYFENVCEQLFRNKDVDTLLFYDSERDRERWLTLGDLNFIIGIGLRRLIELVWEKNVFLIGVVKDSASRYFTKKYLGITKHLGLHSFGNTVLPWSDRMVLEMLPIINEGLEAPWATIEYDGLFSSIHLSYEDGVEKIKSYGYIHPPNIIVRSLAQFFLKRKEKALMQGHVIFVDRPVYDLLDGKHVKKIRINIDGIGETESFFVSDNSVKNEGQDLMMIFLYLLTKNHFPEVIGYPDPLHKADWGARSLLRLVEPMLSSSQILFKSNPLYKTLRQLREDGRR